MANQFLNHAETVLSKVQPLFFVDVRDNLDSRFIKVGKRPTRFFLESR